MDLENVQPLSIDAGLEEVREAVVQYTPEDQTKTNAVYVLRCHDLRFSEDELERRAHRWFNYDDLEDWMLEANNAEVRYYVGESGNVSERIVDHVWRQGAHYTQLFPPKALVDIKWYVTRREAREDEEVVRRGLDFKLCNDEDIELFSIYSD